MLAQLGWFALGALLVALGADSFGQGAAGLALARRAAPLGVGFGVLAFGGMLPEAGVGGIALALGHGGLALGVVLGSGLAALGLVLGITALQRPLPQAFGALRIGALWLGAAGAALWWLGGDAVLGAGDGAALLLGFGAWLAYLGWQLRHEGAAVRERVARMAATRSELWRGLSRIALGLVALGFGAQYLVESSTALAGLAGIGEPAFGLSAVALVLALPKLGAAIFSSRRGSGDMALAAVLGGGLGDVWALPGALAMWQPQLLPAALARAGFPALTAMALVLALTLWRWRALDRLGGGILAAGYAVWFGWWILGPR